MQGARLRTQACAAAPAWAGHLPEIAGALGGTLVLENRENHGRIEGLDATVRLPLVENGA